jgi:hypothetical protein
VQIAEKELFPPEKKVAGARTGTTRVKRQEQNQEQSSSKTEENEGRARTGKREVRGRVDETEGMGASTRSVGKRASRLGGASEQGNADAGDDKRGCMILQWGSQPEYHAWPDQPLYNVWDLSYVIDNADRILKPNMHVRVQLDIEISYEEATFIKDTFIVKHGLREMALIPNKRSALEEDLSPGEVKFESVDQIVTDQITKIDSKMYDPKLLLQIYQSL